MVDSEDIQMKLGINIDHIATLREARYRSHRGIMNRAEPCLLEAARIVQSSGAHGITMHLREDRRHIQEADVWAIRQHIRLPLNLEMSANPAILKIALSIRPDEVCLVPERREEITTEGGLDALKDKRRLGKVIEALHHREIKVSLFITPDARQINTAADLNAESVELHTGAFAEARTVSQRSKEVLRLKKGAELADSIGLRVNAGHGIRYTNVQFIRAIPHLETLNIGHSIISRALIVGLKQAVREMLRKMKSL